MANTNNFLANSGRGGGAHPWLAGAALAVALLALALGVYLFFRKVNMMDTQEFLTFPAGLKSLYKSLIIDKVMAPVGKLVTVAYSKNSSKIDSQIKRSFSRVSSDPKVVNKLAQNFIS